MDFVTINRNTILIGMIALVSVCVLYKFFMRPVEQLEHLEQSEGQEVIEQDAHSPVDISEENITEEITKETECDETQCVRK